MYNKKVLVVEDEEDVLELLRYNLVKDGYIVDLAVNGEEALQKVKFFRPDIILLDLMLPGLDGLEVCREIKKQSDTEFIPIIIVSAKGDDADVIVGLEMEADDYITKPFSPKVLLSRMKAVLRRYDDSNGSPVKSNEIIRIRDIEIEPKKHYVKIKGKPVKLTLAEFKLLYFLASKAGMVFSRYQIVDAVGGSDYHVTDRAVDVQIVGLRKKLGDANTYIETVRGVGYRFIED